MRKNIHLICDEESKPYTSVSTGSRKRLVGSIFISSATERSGQQKSNTRRHNRDPADFLQMKMKRLHQSKLGFGRKRDTGQDIETERKRKRECDGQIIGQLDGIDK